VKPAVCATRLLPCLTCTIPLHDLYCTRSAPRHPLDHAEPFLEAFLGGRLPRKLLSESPQDMERLNELPTGAYVENIAGSQFDEKWVYCFCSSTAEASCSVVSCPITLSSCGFTLK
jgi:hypothetical protein